MRNKYRGEDLRARLDQTYVRYDNVPYYCRTEGPIICLYTVVKGALFLKVEPDDPRLDISSIELGYANNYQHQVSVYLKRIPHRNYKQGISPACMTSKVLVSRGNAFSLNPQHTLSDIGFTNMCAEKYPKFEEAIDLITNKKWHSVALSKEVAICREVDQFQLYIREDCVGWINMKTKKTVLAKKDFPWLYRTILEKNGIEVSQESLF